MNFYSKFFAVLLVAVLLFGCGGSPPAKGSVSASGSVSGNAQAGGSQAGADAGASANAGGSAGAGAGDGSSSGSAGATGSVDFNGMAYAGLVASGVPVECTVKSEGTGTGTAYTSDSKMQIRGKKTRVDSTVTLDSGSYESTSIIDEEAKVMYYTMPSSQRVGPFASCDWMKLDISEQTTQPTQTSTTSSSDLEKLPATSFSCAPGVFSDSVFTVSGSVCDLDQIMKDLTGGASADGSVYGNIGVDYGG